MDEFMQKGEDSAVGRQLTIDRYYGKGVLGDGEAKYFLWRYSGHLKNQHSGAFDGRAPRVVAFARITPRLLQGERNPEQTTDLSTDLFRVSVSAQAQRGNRNVKFQF